jgi:hypothetical protein
MNNQYQPTRLSPRDRDVVNLVAKFKQLRADHIAESLFHGLASGTPLDRSLKRLVAGKYLARIARRLLGGHGGGSEQYVYHLGRQGWRLVGKAGAYWLPRKVNEHTLHIADCFVKLVQAEQRGGLKLLRFDTEPDCHRMVGAISLEPDGYVEVGSLVQNMRLARFLEIDEGTEREDQIQDKCVRYWRAYLGWEEELYPRVLFVVPDQERADFIMRIAEGGPEESRQLFEVCTFDDFCLSSMTGGYQ